MWTVGHHITGWMNDRRQSVGGWGLKTTKPLIQSSPPVFNKWLTKELHMWHWWSNKRMRMPLSQFGQLKKPGWLASHNLLEATTDSAGPNSIDWSLPFRSPDFRSDARTRRKSAPRRCPYPACPWAGGSPGNRRRSAGDHRERRQWTLQDHSEEQQLLCKTVLPPNGWV